MPLTLPEPSTSSARKIEREDVKRLAILARLSLTSDEEAEVVMHVQMMLSYVAKLDQVNTNGVEPMAHAVEMPTFMREDRVTNQPNTEALLLNAPVRAEKFFVVPRVIN